MPNNWEQYAAPASGNKWDQYAQADPVPPTSGPVGAKVPEPDMTPTVGQNAAYEAVEGAKGFGKQLASDANTITSLSPLEAFSRSKGPLLNVNTASENPDQTMGKALAVGAESALPLGKIAEMVPSSARAGKVFESIAKDAAQSPVNLTRSAPILQELQQLGSTGSNLPKAVRQLIRASQPQTLSALDAARVALGGEVSPLQTAQRVLGGDVTPAPGSLLYPKARQFASRISNSSIAERLTSDPNLKRVLGSLREGFNADVGDAAANAGRGEDYEQAMKEFANAKKMQRVGATVGTAAASGLGIGAKLGVLGHILGNITGGQ